MPRLATGTVTLSLTHLEGEPVLDGLIRREFEQRGGAVGSPGEVGRM